MKLLKLIVLAVVIAAGLSFPANVSAAPAPVQGAGCGANDSSSAGQAKQGLDVVSGLNDNAKGGDVNSSQCNGTGVKKIAAAAVSILSYIIGVASIIMLLVSAFKYISSGGDSSKVASAKNTLIYVIVGLVVVALAQFIVRTVLDTSSAAVTAKVCPSDSSKLASDPSCK